MCLPILPHPPLPPSTDLPPLLPPMKRIRRQHPPPHRLRSPHLALLDPRDPLIPPLPQNLHTAHPRRRPNLHPPPHLPRQPILLRQHIQIPQRHPGRHAFRRTRADRRAEFQEAEVGRLVRGLGAEADADELDLREQEAVAAGVVAHDALQVGEAGEVEDLLVADFVAHARVPAVVGLDEPDDAGARGAGEGGGGVGLVVAQEVGAFGGVACGGGAHGDVVGPAQAGFERGVDFWEVEVAAEFEESGFRGWG